MPTREDFAYFAGLFDGEGSIDMSTGRIRVPRLKLSMTDYPTIQWLADTFGGNVYFEKPSGSAVKDAWKWSATPQSHVRMVLEGSLPFLITKRDRAEAALAVLDYLKAATGSSYRDDGWFQGLVELGERCFARAWPQRVNHDPAGNTAL